MTQQTKEYSRPFPSKIMQKGKLRAPPKPLPSTSLRRSPQSNVQEQNVQEQTIVMKPRSSALKTQSIKSTPTSKKDQQVLVQTIVVKPRSSALKKQSIKSKRVSIKQQQIVPKISSTKFRSSLFPSEKTNRPPTHALIPFLTGQQRHVNQKNMKEFQKLKDDLTAKRSILTTNKDASRFLYKLLEKKKLRSVVFDDPVALSLVRLNRLVYAIQFWRLLRDTTRTSGWGIFSSPAMSLKFNLVFNYLKTGDKSILNQILLELYRKEASHRKDLLKLTWPSFKKAWLKLLLNDPNISTTLNDVLIDVGALIGSKNKEDKTLVQTATRNGSKYVDSLETIGSDLSNYHNKTLPPKSSTDADRLRRFISSSRTTHRDPEKLFKIQDQHVILI